MTQERIEKNEVGIENLNPPDENAKHREFYRGNMNLLRRRFDAGLGFFGQIATRFSALSWWQQGVIGLLIGGVFALIGLAFSIAWVIALPIIAISLYVGIALLFENYAQSENCRFEHMTEAIVQQQQFMEAYHNAMQITERQLHQSIKNLDESNQQLTGVSALQHEQAVSLEQDVQHYKNEVVAIQQLKADILSRAQGLQVTESQFSHELDDMTDLFNQQINRLMVMAAEAETATNSLRNTAASLKNETLAMQAKTSPPLQRVSLDTLLEGYKFITEEEHLRDREEAKQRSESHRKAAEENRLVDERIQQLQEFLVQRQEAVPNPFASFH